MNKYRIFILPCVIALLSLLSCEKEATVITESAVIRTFKGAIDLENLANYSNQTIPAYIPKTIPLAILSQTKAPLWVEFCFMTKTYLSIIPYRVQVVTNKHLLLVIRQ